MADSLSILENFSQVFTIFCHIKHRSDVDGYPHLLDSVQNTLRDVEIFAQHCRDLSPQDHDSAIGTPDVIPSSDVSDVHISENSATIQHVSPTAVASTARELPTLCSDPQFDQGEAEIHACFTSDHGVSPMTPSFDHDRYAYNGYRLGEEQNKQHGESQQEDTNGDRDAHQEKGREETAVDHVPEPGRIPGRVTIENDDEVLPRQQTSTSSGTVDQHTQTSLETLPECPKGGNPKKRKHRDQPQIGSGPQVRRLPDLNLIANKVTSPNDMYDALVAQAGDYASDAPRMRFLTCLVFHFAGPYAFQGVGDAFSAMCRTVEIDFTTTGGRIRALDRI